MPSSVQAVARSAGLQLTGHVPWSTSVPSTASGIYIVSLSSDPDAEGSDFSKPPINRDAVQAWIKRVSTLRMDGVVPSVDALVKRLGEFWLEDESILYIGLTTRALSKRVSEYYKTPLGDSRPHSGGHWLKTLDVLESTFVHYAEVDDVEAGGMRTPTMFRWN